MARSKSAMAAASIRLGRRRRRRAGRAPASLGGRRQIARAGAAAVISPGVSHREIEDRAAVVGEIESVLAVGDVDLVGEEEVRAHQHVRIAETAGRQRSSLAVANFLVADLEAGHRRDPGFTAFRPTPPIRPPSAAPGPLTSTSARLAASSVMIEAEAPVSNITGSWPRSRLRSPSADLNSPVLPCTMRLAPFEVRGLHVARADVDRRKRRGRAQ